MTQPRSETLFSQEKGSSIDTGYRWIKALYLVKGATSKRGHTVRFHFSFHSEWAHTETGSRIVAASGEWEIQSDSRRAQGFLLS